MPLAIKVLPRHLSVEELQRQKKQRLDVSTCKTAAHSWNNMSNLLISFVTRNWTKKNSLQTSALKSFMECSAFYRASMMHTTPRLSKRCSSTRITSIVTTWRKPEMCRRST